MKNPQAISLAQAAQEYRRTELKHIMLHTKQGNLDAADESAVEIIKQDYIDLMHIVEMIENGANRKKIALAMADLETAVRDVIPNDVYNAFVFAQ